MYFDPGGEGGVIDGGNTVREDRSMFGDRGGGVSEGSSPGVMVETKVRAGVVSGRKGGRSWSSVEVPAGAAMVALISWIPLSEGETRVGRDGAGGVVKLAADLHEDVAQKIESPPQAEVGGLASRPP